MCFSLTASLSAGIILGATGIALQIKQKPARHEQGLACLPLIFASHQLIEAGVWATVGASNSTASPTVVNTLLTYCYVFIAFTFWPIYVPLAIKYFNQGEYNRILVCLTYLGLAVGVYLFYSYVVYHPVSSSVGCGRTGCHSLVYDVQDPLFHHAIKYPYLVAVTFPFFFCMNKRVRWILGPLFLISFPVGMILAYDESFPSIWCFIAATISITTYCVFSTKKTQA